MGLIMNTDRTKSKSDYFSSNIFLNSNIILVTFLSSNVFFPQSSPSLLPTSIALTVENPECSPLELISQ